MKAAWKRLGCGLLVVALSGAFTGCGDDEGDDDDDGASGKGGTGGSSDPAGTGGKGGTGGSAGKGGAGGGGGGGKGGSGGSTVACGNSDALSTECVTCVKGEVSECGDECVALLNCTATKCGTTTSEEEQTACVMSCCLEEAITAVGAPGGRDALKAAQTAQRAECAATCTGDAADGGT